MRPPHIQDDGSILEIEPRMLNIRARDFQRLRGNEIELRHDGHKSRRCAALRRPTFNKTYNNLPYTPSLLWISLRQTLLLPHLLPTPKPKYPRQPFPDLSPTLRMLPLTMCHAGLTQIQPTPRRILPQGTRRLPRFNDMPFSMRHPCIRTQVTLTRRRTLKHKEKQIRQAHLRLSQSFPPNKTHHLVSPRNIRRTLRKHPPRLHPGYAIIRIREHLRYIVFLGQHRRAHHRIRIILFGRISIRLGHIVVECRGEFRDEESDASLPE
jgi:hypothetical protein